MRVSTTRRQFLGGAGAAVVVGTTGVGALWPTPAKAYFIEPLTMIALGQAAVSLWNMSRGSGPGTASLLRQQTEMLRAISQQLAVVDARLQEIYNRIGDLANVIDQLPSVTVRELYSRNLSGMFRRASEIMRLAATYREQRGLEYAIQEVEDEANRDVLNELRNARSILMSDSSLAVTPIVAAAWYVELEVETNAVRFRRERIVEAARTYHEAFTGWNARLDEEIATIEAKAAEMATRMGGYPTLDGYNCYVDVDLRSRQVPSRPGPREGDIPGYGIYDANGTNLALYSAAIAPDPRWQQYAAGFAELRTAGVVIPPTLTSFAPRTWRTTSSGYGFHAEGYKHRHAERDFGRARETLEGNRCERKRGDPRTIAATENRAQAEADLLQARALAHYSFQLCCKSALASINSVLESPATA